MFSSVLTPVVYSVDFNSLEHKKKQGVIALGVIIELINEDQV
jgi:hypothetical protein